MGGKVLATIGSGPMAAVLREALPTFRDFADRHGYRLAVGEGGDAPGRSPAWAKVPFIRRLLDDHELVFWIDSDAIILDGSQDPASLVPADSYQAMVLNRWQGFESPCTGIWLLRGDDRAKAFVDAVWAAADYHQEHPWEQAVAMRLLGYQVWPARPVADTEWSAGTTWLAEEEWGRIPILDPGRRLEPCRIRHYAATPNHIRRNQMRADRHAIAAREGDGAAARWHRALALAGRARWRFVYAPERHRPLRRATTRFRKARDRQEGI